jgi:uncharacterized metal-binding protein YceD (DUF177 family)
MTRGRDTTAPPHPWRVNVAVDHIPEAGLHQTIAADASQCAAMSELAGLRGLSEVRAGFELRHAGRGRVHVVGWVKALVGQTCVVTLEPLENAIDEPIDLLFAPEDQVEAIAKAMENEAETDGEVPDPPEAIVGGMIDLGKLAADALFLGIDPYPRKPEAVFEPPVTPEDPESHPFAALKALKGESPPPKPKKSKDL